MKTARIISDWFYNSLTLIISTLCISLIYALGSEIINDNSRAPILPQADLMAVIDYFKKPNNDIDILSKKDSAQKVIKK